MSDWTYGFDTDYRDDLNRYYKRDRNLADTFRKRTEAIIENPVKGEPKTAVMAGLYGVHVASHWVIIYELSPHKLYSRGDLETLNEVYFHRIVHHDNQRCCVKQITPVTLETDYEITLPVNSEGYRTVSKLHDNPSITVSDVEYGVSGITVAGSYEPNKESEFNSLVPKTASMQCTSPSVTDLIEAT